MKTRADRADNVPSVQLANREKIQSRSEEPHPRGTSHRMKKQVGRLRVWLEHGGSGLQDKWHAENEVGVCVATNGGNDFGMEHSVSQRR